MGRHPFLSDEWFAAARRVVDERRDELAAGTARPEVTMNLLVTGTPFGDDCQLHLSTAANAEDWGKGHVAGADLTLTTDYATAREIFIAGTVQRAIQALMEGRVKLQGDLTKLLAAQGTGAAGEGAAGTGLVEALGAITE